MKTIKCWCLAVVDFGVLETCSGVFFTFIFLSLQHIFNVPCKKVSEICGSCRTELLNDTEIRFKIYRKEIYKAE